MIATLEVDRTLLRTPVRGKQTWTPETIGQAIRALRIQRIALHTSSMRNDRTMSTALVIKGAIGELKTAQSLHRFARAQFGSWSLALLSAGIKPKYVRGRPFMWTKRSIGQIIAALHKEGISLNETDIMKDKSPKTTNIIREVSGRTLQGRSLHPVAKKYFGSWAKAALFSGVNAKSCCDPYWEATLSMPEILKIIQMLKQRKFPLNYAALVNRPKYKNVEFINRRPLRTRSLVRRAEKKFGSWDNAIKAAGIDPLYVRLKSMPNISNFPLLETHAETIMIDGEMRQVVYLGEAPTSPEAALSEMETGRNLGKALAASSKEDPKFTKRIVNEILKISAFDSQQDLAKKVATALKYSVSEEDVFSVLARLSNHFSRLERSGPKRLPAFATAKQLA